jgi:hypothetical protein
MWLEPTPRSGLACAYPPRRGETPAAAEAAPQTNSLFHSALPHSADRQTCVQRAPRSSSSNSSSSSTRRCRG